MITSTSDNFTLPNPTPPNTTLHIRSVPVTPVMRRQTDFSAPITLKYATISSYSSNHSLHSLGKSSPFVPRRSEPAPPTPPSPSTFVTNVKGSKYEISGPMNFQHMAGDMTRDRTRNAFDLSLTTNDNVLRKYMIEHGIKEEDLKGMRKEDVIKNIVQSKFTWMPLKRNDNVMERRQSSSNIIKTSSSTHNGRIATSTARVSRSRKTMNAPPPPPPTIVPEPEFTLGGSTISASTPPSPPTSSEAKALEASQSSLHFLSERFADPSEFPSIEDIYGKNMVVEADSAQFSVQSRLTCRKPSPTPPIKSYTIVDTTLPPPSLVRAINNLSASNQSLESLDDKSDCDRVTNESLYGKTIIVRSELLSEPEITICPKENIYSTIKPINSIGRRVEPAAGNGLYAKLAEGKKSVRPTPPPIPPKPALKLPYIVNAPPIPPPLFPPLPHVPLSAMGSASKIESGRMPSPPPSGFTGIPQPPPQPQPPNIQNRTDHSRCETAVPPQSPPPPYTLNGSADTPVAQASAKNSDDKRGALLDSIRKGVVLKKVDKQVIEPRDEHKPKTNDFLSELKMGITLRRVKNTKDIPYAGENPDESQA
ncbi:uncharacterized protein Whamy isoform X2 [Eurosta solidaginis]